MFKVMNLIQANKCNGSCNNINDPYGKLSVPDYANKINIKVFNIMPRSNKTRHIEWYETCKFKCRLDGRVRNNKQRWKKDKCRCVCKELIDKVTCYKGFICNTGISDCECNKSCDVGEY